MTDIHSAYLEAQAANNGATDLGAGNVNGRFANTRRHRFPDFLTIGAEKAGTTWLHRNLDYHPDLWLTPVKELNYFSQLYSSSETMWEIEARRKGAQDARAYFESLPALNEADRARHQALSLIESPHVSDAWYGRIFAHAPDDKFCGESSPDYCVLPRAAVAHIASLNPKMRIFLILRDPIDRLWSHMKMDAHRNGLSTFEDFFNLPEISRGFFGRSNYPEIIRRWSATFGDRLTILDYDWIFEKPYFLLQIACERIGVRFDRRYFPLARTKVGHGHAAEFPVELYNIARERLKPIYDELNQLLPHFSTKWTTRHFS